VGLNPYIFYRANGYFLEPKVSEPKLCTSCEELKTKFFSQVEIKKGIFKRICRDCWDKYSGKLRQSPSPNLLNSQEDDHMTLEEWAEKEVPSLGKDISNHLEIYGLKGFFQREECIRCILTSVRQAIEDPPTSTKDEGEGDGD